MSTLRIYLTAHWHDAASPCQWVLLDPSGHVTDSGLGSLASMPAAEHAEVILAADCVISTLAAVPKIKRNKLETALPFLLEDYLLTDVNDIHVTAGEKLADGRTRLYAVQRSWLERFLDACAVARLRVRHALPIYSLLPQPAHECSIVWDNEMAFMASGQHAGSALGLVEMSQAPAALQLHLHQVGEAIRSVRLLNSGLTQPPAWEVTPALELATQPFDWRRAPRPADAPNLLWGKFAPAPRIQEFWPLLRPAAMAALLLLTLHLVASNLEWALLAHEHRQLEQQMDDVFRETFGADSIIVDAPLQMRRNIANLRHAAGQSDEADFMPLLDKFALASKDSTGKRLTSVRYASGKMDIELTLPNRSELDTLQQQLSAHGLQIQLIDSSESSNALNVQLRLTPGGTR